MSASKLIRPSTDYKDSYLEALREYHEEGRYPYQEIDALTHDFDGFVKELSAEKGYPHQPYEDWVDPMPETIVWMVKDETYIGTVDIRHRLNWHLERWGGHVHYVVRPSMRGKGYGRKMLRKAMPIINYIGIDNALLTICPNNQWAINIAEECGAVFEDETHATDKFPAARRYWLNCT